MMKVTKLVFALGITAATVFPRGPVMADEGGSRPAPRIAVHQRAELLVDADGSFDVSAGDVLLYTVTVENAGPSSAPDTVFYTAPGRGSVLVSGSVATTLGAVSSGNGTGDSTVEVDLGKLPGKTRATVTYEAEVTPEASGKISNQGAVSAGGVPAVLSDDPATPEIADPTVTWIGSGARLDAVKFVERSGDEDDDSKDDEDEDHLRYTVTVRNAGTDPAAGVVLSDTPGDHTRLVAGSVTTTQGTVASGNGENEAEVRVELGEIAAGEPATVTFEVSLDRRRPRTVESVSNQGLVTFDGDPAGQPTDDPGTYAVDDATVLALPSRPLLDAVKTDTLRLDLDGDGLAGPGDVVRYVVVISNYGRRQLKDVVFTDVPDAETVLVEGSVVTSEGRVTSGNRAGDGSVEVEIGKLKGRRGVTVAFDVLVRDPLPSGVLSVANQGEVRADRRPAVPTDDPATAESDDPTVTPLAVAALGGRAWNDLDGDGVREAGEPGLSGVAVRLLDAADLEVAATATDSEGVFLFASLRPGDYSVVFTAAGGFSFSPRDQGADDELDSDVDPATGRTAVVSLEPGELDLSVGAGLVEAGNAALGDFIWHDLDADGVQGEEEPGLAGVVVRLLDAAGDPAGETATDDDGLYLFDGVEPGDYSVEIAPPAGFVLAPAGQGGDEAEDSDFDPATFRSGVVRVAAGDEVRTVDGGLYLPASISGFVWSDFDGDGIQAPAEAGIDDVAVSLYDAAGDLVARVRTDRDGTYRFDALTPGTYFVGFERPFDLEWSPRDQGGDDSRDSDADPTTGQTAAVPLASGAGADFDGGLFEPLTTLTSSPANGETGVSLRHETIVRFSNALGASASLSGANFFAEFGGRRLAARVHLSPDRRTATLFYDDPLPPSARVRVTLVGDGLENRFGADVDADRDGRPGGTAVIDFDTLGLATLPDTSVCGRVFASELVPGDGGMSLNVPLEGVTITVDGLESTLFALTDGLGNFCLDPAPAGRFFVHIDGRTATAGVPPGAYYPFVGKAWESVPGRQVNVGDVFLPLVPAGSLQPVSRTADTAITFAPSVLADFPEFAGTEIMVPADSLFADDGGRGGMAGIVPVPPDRLPGTLPPGLEFPVVISVQTDGATNFDVPVPVCFPNLPDPVLGAPLPPGERNALFSFNHDSGKWEHVGPMRVTADGSLICTDRGVGILAPGWHGSGPPPTEPPPPPKPDPPPPPCPPTNSQCNEEFQDYINHCLTEYQIVVAGDAVLQAAELVLCLKTGPLSFHCIAHILAWSAAVKAASAAWYAECLANAQVWLDICLKASRNPRPPDCTSAVETPLAVKGPAFPGDPEADPVVRLFREMEALARPFPGEVPPEVAEQVEALLAEADAVAGGSAVEYLEAFQLAAEPFAQPYDAVSGPVPGNNQPAAGNAPPYPILFAADIERADEFLTLRGETGPLGQYTLFVPRDGTLRAVSFYDPRTKSYGMRAPRQTPGLRYQMPRAQLVPVDDSFPDTDGDGLADNVEDVYGTDFFNPDTDGDGVADGAEADQGTNPLDGLPTRTGVIATADTPGTAVGVCAVDDVAAVADGTAGLSVFNVFNGMTPVAVAQVDTPGTAQAVACAGRLIAVADGTAGLAVVEVSDPPAARLLHQVGLGGAAQAVAVAGDIAYAALSSGSLVAVDLASGSVLGDVALGGAVQDVAVEGDFVYALTHTALHVFDPFAGGLANVASVAVDGSASPLETGRKLFVGGGLAYVGHFRGYSVVDVSLPTAPRLLASPPSTQLAVHDLGVNGSGLLLSTTSFAGPQTLAVSLYDASEPTDVTRFLTSFETPGDSRALSVFNGLAYVADSRAGLQVVNYLPYDALGVAPTVALSTNFAPGVAEEGQLLRMTARVGDDVQVRNVEFFVDGERAVTDGTFPFEHRFVTPLIADRPALTIRACASDTGGNRSCTAESTLVLTEDATPPRITGVTPANGAGVAQGSTAAISAAFSEPIDLATLDAGTFQLFAAGPDEQAGTGDDVLVPDAAFDFREDIRTAFLTFETALPVGLYRGVVRAAVSDLKGNPIAGEFAWTFRVKGPLFWTNPAGGSWNDPANWSEGAVPTATDIVRITLPGDYTVVLNGNATVGRLTVGSAAGGPTLWINGASAGGHTTLTVTDELLNSGTLRLESSNSTFSSNLTVESGIFVNLGRLEVDEGSRGPRVVSADLLNQGTVSVGFDLTLSRAGGLYVNEGEIEVADTRTLTMTGQGQVFRQNRGAITGPGSVEVGGGATFELNGGTVSESPPLIVSSTVDFGAGAAADTASFIATGGNARARGSMAGGHTLWVRGGSVGGHTTVDVNGLVNAGTIRLESNVSTFSSNLSGDFTNAVGGVVSVREGTRGPRLISGDLTNRGILDVDFGLSSLGTLTNTGTIDVAAGQKLSIPGRVLRHDGGTITGAGVVELTSGASLEFNGGTVEPTPPLLVNSALAFGAGSTGRATFILTGGNGELSGDVSPGQTVWISGRSAGSHTTVTAAGPFVNGGTLRLESENSTFASNLTVAGGTLTNSGLIEIEQGTGGVRNVTGIVRNESLLDVNDDAVFNGRLENAGTIDVASGNTFTVNAGQDYVHDGGDIAGAGSVRLTGGALFTFVSGTTTGSAPVLVRSDLTFAAGASGVATLVMTGNGELSGAQGAEQTVWISGSSLGSHTTITAADGFVNRGTIRLESRNSTFASNLAGTFTNDEGGLIRVDEGTRGVRNLTGEVTNRGNLEVNYDLTAGGTLTNVGTVGVAAGATLSMSGAGNVFNHDGGTLAGAGDLRFASGVAFNFNGGTASAEPRLVNSALRIGPAATGAATFVLSGSGGSLAGDVAAGQTVWISGRSDGSHTTITAATGFTNAGTLRLESASSTFHSGLAVTAGVLLNTGRIEVNQGTGGARSLAAELDNRGEVAVGRSLSLGRAGALHRNAGVVDVAAGTVVTLTGASFDNAAGGVLRGEGTLGVAGVALVNGGEVDPGTSPGILTVTGDYSQSAAGAVNIEIGGLAAGSQHDQLRVSGVAALDGRLDVVLIGGFVPSVGDSFPVLTYGSRSGMFAAFGGLDLGGGLLLEPTYTPTGLTLTVVPQP